jgi:hypothetical protein
MIDTRAKLYKPILVALAAVLLVASSTTQRRLNRSRETLGFTRVSPLQNAPPILVLTTVVLGGFRGLIANALWVRAMDLQDQDKFFEMVQLADWITKLQPHMNSVWIVQAWNMSYNISIKFSDPQDRWMWVRRGIELLRDEALKYNPHEVLLYRELAWHFQHKMGHNLDDAHWYFKNVWAGEMHELLGGGRPNFDELITPPNDEVKGRVRRLKEVYKLDPAKMKAADERYGPLDWRMPETHAIYWASLGRERAKKKEDLISLRRVVYQSMQWAFRRGRLIENKFDKSYRFDTNLDIIPKVNAAYEEMIAEDAEMRDHIAIAHRNFLLDAVYFLYTHNRMKEAAQWLNVVKQKYPKDYPRAMTLDEYALKRVGEDAAETDVDRTTANLTGILSDMYINLALGDDDQATALGLLARNIWSRFQSKIAGGPSEKRVGLPPLQQIREEVLDRLLDPERGLNPPLAAQLRTAVGRPPPATTNAVPSAATAPKSP